MTPKSDSPIRSCQMNRYVLAAVTVLAFLSARPSAAQEVRGTILGRVTDPQEAVIPNANVQLTHVATGLISNVHTNEQGLYQAPYLPLGMYKVTAEAKGFKKVVRD